MRKFIGRLFSICGVAGGLYVGLWLMCIKPIINIIEFTSNDAMTTGLWVSSILKIVFALSVGGAIAFAGILFDVIINSIDTY